MWSNLLENVNNEATGSCAKDRESDSMSDGSSLGWLCAALSARNRIEGELKRENDALIISLKDAHWKSKLK